MERCKALVCRRLFDESNPLLRIGRFDVIRTVGRGATGTVYEAADVRDGARVALKMLYRGGPAPLFRLKREFRALRQIRHPNLVELHELWVTEHEAFFTMELVDGLDFASFAGEALSNGSESRFRQAVQGLCRGVQALHERAKLHCDLKPSNVLVTRSGRVVLLDLGLILDVAGADEDEDEGGTPGYVAPERLSGTVDRASDWYAVGVMMRAALSQAGATPTTSLDDLKELAGRLAQADPGKRPQFDEISSIVDGPSPRPARYVRSTYTDTKSPGRQRELTVLTDAFAATTRRAAVVVLSGESGIGKTALLEEFERTVLDPAGALTLSGRCHEREHVPYKGVDAIMDALARHLVTAPALVDVLATAHVAALLDLFPVLSRVPHLRRRAPSSDVGRVWDRVRAVDALKILFRAIALERPCVLLIEDVQWAGAASGRFLADVLSGEDSPVRLAVLAERPWGGASRRMREAFETRVRSSTDPPFASCLELKPTSYE